MFNLKKKSEKNLSLDILYKDEIDTILNAFNIPENLGRGYFDFYSNIGKELEDYQLRNFIDDIVSDISAYTPISVRYGVSKLVIIPQNFPFVIKIPFNGCFYFNDSEMPDFGEKYSEKDFSTSKEYYDFITEKEEEWAVENFEESTFFEPFTEANKEFPEDYCFEEFQIYETVKDRGFSDFFANTIFYTEKDGRKIYIQEKACTYKAGGKTSPSKKSLNKVQKLGIHSYFGNSWIALAIDFYGEALVQKFLDYIEIDEDDIDVGNDMHNDNYGYRLDGSPCIIDFSGWRE